LNPLRLGLCLVCFALLISGALAAETKKVLILPFTVHAEKDMSFLQAGVQDMLSSRLSWKDRVEVIDKARSLEIHRYLGESPGVEEVLSAGAGVGADYVVFGSLTLLGGVVSLDSKVLNVREGRVVQAFFDQIPGIDQLIPRMDDFAVRMNQEVFQRKPLSESAQAAAEPADIESMEEEPSYMAPGFFMTPSDKIRSTAFNPNILRPAGGRDFYWQSHQLPFHVKGFDIGDVMGDGKNDLVAVTDREVRVFQMREGGLAEMAKYQAPAFHTLITVDVADITGDGLAEIYVVAEAGTMGDTRSIVLEMHEGRLIPVIEQSSWNFRVIRNPETGKPMLVGQIKRVESLAPGVFELKRTPKGLQQGRKLDLPSKANAFNFALADLNNDGRIRVVLINRDDYLEVTSTTGDSFWESDSYFGGTMNYITLKYENPFTAELSDRMYVPARIIIADMDRGNVPEVIVNRNKSATFRLLGRYKFFSGCEIVSLSWKGLGLMENWSTKRIPGYVPDLQLKDLDNDGIDDLVVVMVKLDPAGIAPPKSTFISFQLGLSEGGR